MYSFDWISFFAGFLFATFLWWGIRNGKSLLAQIREGWSARKEASASKSAGGLERRYRKSIIRKAQGMHLAAPLFSLSEILIPPRLIAPPVQKRPGEEDIQEDESVAQAVPYTPGLSLLATTYRLATFSLPEALSGGAPLAILGEPGSGRTVALAYLATLAANRSPELGALQQSIPFLLHVADMTFPSEEEDILAPVIEEVAEHAGMLGSARVPAFVRTAFHSGRALFLLDGLDELPPKEMDSAVAYLSRLRQTYPNIHMVTTASPEYLDGLFRAGFSVLTLAGWNDSQKEAFLRRWASLWEEFVLVEAWAQTEIVPVDSLLLNAWLMADTMGQTPLEITLKTWGAYAGDLRGGSSVDALETHLRRISPQDLPVAASEMLAMQVLLTEQPIFDSRAARAWVKSFEPPEEKPPEDEDADERKKTGGPAPTRSILSKMAASGLLTTHRRNRMRFVHEVFAGLLAGRALSGYQADDKLLEQPAWSGRTLAMRYLASEGEAASLVDSLLEMPDPLVERNLLTAARLLRDAPLDASWRGKVMMRLAKMLQDDKRTLRFRAMVLTEIALSNDKGRAALFRQFLGVSSSYQVQLAALGSGLLRDAKAVDLLAASFQISNPFVWRAACLALVNIGTMPALEAVATALLQGNEMLRRAAAESLANHPSEGWAMLRDAITMDDVMVRHAAVFGLARVGEPWADELLEKIQVEDAEWLVRNAAAGILERRSQLNPSVPRPLPPPSESPWLLEFAGKQGMGIAPGSPATDILLSALKSENDEAFAALPYLRQMPSEGVVGALYDAMERGDVRQREAVFLTLWEIAASGVSLPNPVAFGVGG